MSLKSIKMADSKQTSPTESTKVNLVLLKQILEDESSDNTEVDEQGLHSEGNTDDSSQGEAPVVKPKREKDKAGPTGRYPVLFSKRCRSKSCQTKLSMFPLFPVPQETEWISDEEMNSKAKGCVKKTVAKKKKRKRDSIGSTSAGKENEKENGRKIGKENGKDSDSRIKNSDRSRKDLKTEHQLKETSNPVMKAWLYHKNKLNRKMRREERKVKRAQRVALEEEIRIKNERLEQSEKRVQEWFKVKHKEARKIWKQNHPKVSPFDIASDKSHSPPEYRIVKSFKSKQPCTKSMSSSDTRHGSTTADSTNEKALYNKVDKNQTSNADHVQQKPRKRVNAVQEHIKMEGKRSNGTQSPKERPKTANSPLPGRKNTPKTRPKTAGQTKKESESVEEMQSMSYEQWLKSKREQDKRRTIEKKHLLIDSHLDAVIAKLGKQRVQNIMAPRKYVDTSLKNYLRSPTRSRNQYKWMPSNDAPHGAPRPEPQGCDYPEIAHTNADQERQAVNFCKEVTDKCKTLQPSMDKVLSVLDAEIKKISNEKKNTQKPPTYETPSGISTTNATANSIDTEDSARDALPGCIPLDIHATKDSLSSCTKPARPRTARPKSAFVDNTNLTSVDTLGLCTDEDLDNKVSLPTEKSDSLTTVRSNYFYYGSDVHLPIADM